MENIISKLQEWVAFYGIKVIVALAILVVGRWIAKGLKSLLKKGMQRQKVEEMIISFTGNLVYTGLMVFVVLAALGQLGIQTASFVAVIGAAGLAIALALQGSLSNFAAGFLMMIFKPFKSGDYIEGAGTAGVVEKVHVFTTQLKTPDNKAVIIPNAKLMGDNIVNYNAKETRRVEVIVGVSYSSDIDQVRQVLQAVIGEESRILPDPAPVIVVKELADSSVNFAVRIWTETSDFWPVFFDMNEAVKKRFDKEGIEIPFPQRDVHLYQTAQ